MSCHVIVKGHVHVKVNVKVPFNVLVNGQVNVDLKGSSYGRGLA